MKLLIYSLLYLIVFNIATHDRLFYVGTIEEYNSGTIPHIRDLPLWYLTVFLGITIAIVVLMFVLIKFSRDLNNPWREEDQANLEKRKKIVSIKKVEKGVKNEILLSLALWDGKAYIKELIEKKNNKVLIKANFSGGGKDKEGTQTSMEVLSATIDIVREISPNANIMIVESDSIFWRVDNLLKKSKYQELFKDKNIPFFNLSKGERVLHNFGGRMGEEPISKLLLEPHVLIDIPVAKTHSFYRMSGAIKNLFGLTPGHHKFLLYHSKGFADPKGRIFIDIYRNFIPDLIILDGLISCECNGPYGKPKKTDFIITSDDAISTDIILARIMGYHEKQISYLNLLFKEGMKCDVNLLGDDLELVKPQSWKKANKFGFLTNLLKVYGQNIKLRLTKQSFILVLFIVGLSLLGCLLVEIINAYIVKWWYYSYDYTLIAIIIIWALLGGILAYIRIIERRRAAGPAFAIWGVSVEIVNLMRLNLWYFSSTLTMVGTFVIWILLGFSIWCIQSIFILRSRRNV